MSYQAYLEELEERIQDKVFEASQWDGEQVRAFIYRKFPKPNTQWMASSLSLHEIRMDSLIQDPTGRTEENLIDNAILFSFMGKGYNMKIIDGEDGEILILRKVQK